MHTGFRVKEMEMRITALALPKGGTWASDVTSLNLGSAAGILLD